MRAPVCQTNNRDEAATLTANQDTEPKNAGAGKINDSPSVLCYTTADTMLLSRREREREDDNRKTHQFNKKNNNRGVVEDDGGRGKQMGGGRVGWLNKHIRAKHM